MTDRYLAPATLIVGENEISVKANLRLDVSGWHGELTATGETDLSDIPLIKPLQIRMLDGNLSDGYISQRKALQSHVVLFRCSGKPPF